MKKYNKRKKTQQSKRKQEKRKVTPIRKSGSQIVLFVKRHSAVSLIVISCTVLLVIVLIIIGARKKPVNEADMISSDMSQPSGSPIITNASPSRDESITYTDPSDTFTPVPGSKAQETVGEETPKLIDLTVLSSTMIYAEVYNIMAHPNEYMGKTIKMSGPYYASYYEVTDLYYHYVVIEDATACCQQGLEFKWNGEHKFPDDYPDESTKIEVTGVFSSYDELGRTYYYIAVDDISILE